MGDTDAPPCRAPGNGRSSVTSQKKTRHACADAEAAPMEQAEFYQFDIDVAQVAEVVCRGSVVESWLQEIWSAWAHL